MAGKSDSELLRECAKWFDLVDELCDSIVVTVAATGETYRLIEKIGSGRELQHDLLRIADDLEKS